MPAPTPDIATVLLAELGWVRRLAQSLVGDDAEDLTQEVATAALQRRPRPERLRTWLGSVTRRQAARLRRDRLRRSQVEHAQAPRAPADDPIAVVEQLQQQRHLVECVLGLTEPYRSVIVRHFFDGLAPVEIARRGELPPATVRQQIRRGLAMLRERLERDAGPDWRGALLGLAFPGTGRTGVLLGALMMKKVVLAALAVALLAVLWSVIPTDSFRDPDPTSTGSKLTPQIVDAGAAPVGTTEGENREGVRRPIKSTQADSFRVTVVSDQGVAVADAYVLIHCEGKVQVGLTDSQGQASLKAEPSAGCILVYPGNRPPLLESVETLAGKRKIVLPGSGVVAGRVHVFDRPLAGRVRLELYDDDSATSLRPKLPPALQQELDFGSVSRYFGLRLHHLSTRTDSSGAFVFRGLRPGWSGSLRISYHSPHLIRPKESSLKIRGFKSAIVPQATDDIVLALTRLPAVHGRIVWDDGTLATGAGLNLSAQYEGRHRSGTMGSRVDSEGMFQIGLRPFATKTSEQWLNPENFLAIKQVQVHWSHRDAIEHRARTVAASSVGQDIDLGDLVLKRAATLHVLVHNPVGKPIARALVGGTGPSSRTDQDGRCVIKAKDADCRTFRIGALGCLVARYTAVAGTGTPTDPLQFALRRGNQLTIQVHPGAFRLDGLRLELRSAGRIYTDSYANESVLSNIHLASGSSDAQSTWWRTGGSLVNMRFRLGQRDKIELCSIVPGLTVRLRLIDFAKQVVLEQNIVLPAAEQHALIHLRPNATVSTIRGTVTLDGAPLSGARVKLPNGSIDSDDAGEFEVHLLASGSPIRVTVRHPKSVPFETDLRLNAGVQSPRLQLTRGFDIEVRVVDADGIAVDAPVRLAGSKEADKVQRVASGQYRFSGLPARSTIFTTEIAGRKFERTVRPDRKSRVEIRVPRLICVRPQFPTGLDTKFVELELRDTEHSERSLRVQFNLRNSGQWLPAEVFLFPGSYRVSQIRDESLRAHGKPWSAVWTIGTGGKTIERRVLY